MAQRDVDGLRALVAVARERSFTRASARLGVSQSALSQTLRALEARLGLRLLTRTTRSVSPTEAGERLLLAIEPALDQIDRGLAALSELRDRPAGTVRLSAGEHPAVTLLWPKLQRFLATYPDVRVEIAVENGLIDLAEGRYDAGVRLGEQVAQHMIAVRISPDIRFAVVGAPSCFEGRSPPATPQELVNHRCINLRLATHGGLYAWEFEKDGRDLRVRVEGQLVFNSILRVLDAALDGFGLAYLPEDLVRPHLADGRLRRVLDDWSPPWPGYHLYYPSRRQPSPAFSLLIEALRHPPKPSAR